MDLHIGVTTSSGTIVEFDRNGLRRHRSGQWNQCLLLDQADSPWIEHWDNTLLQVCKYKCWSAKSYNEDRHNCYSFVLTFLMSLNYGNLSKAASSRTVFCEKFIVPRTTAAGKYISLYRKLKENGCYVHRISKWYLFDSLFVVFVHIFMYVGILLFTEIYSKVLLYTEIYSFIMGTSEMNFLVSHYKVMIK